MRPHQQISHGLCRHRAIMQKTRYSKCYAYLIAFCAVMHYTAFNIKLRNIILPTKNRTLPSKSPNSILGGVSHPPTPPHGTGPEDTPFSSVEFFMPVRFDYFYMKMLSPQKLKKKGLVLLSQPVENFCF